MASTAQSPLRQLLSYSVFYRTRFIRATIFSALNKTFDIAPEILIGVAVDVVVQKQNSWLSKLGITDAFDQLKLLALVTFLIWFFESLFEYLYSLDWRNLAQRVQHDLRLDAYEHVQNLDVSYFEDKNAGSLVSILNDDINQLERFLDGGANALIQILTAVVLISGIFFYVAPQIAGWAMVPIPLIIWSAFWYQKRAEPLYANVREMAGHLSSRLTSNLSGITTIKSQTAETLELERVRAESEQYLLANRGAIAMSSAFIPVIRMAILAGFIATLVLGGWEVLHGNLAIGSYSVLVYLTQRLLWPLTTLAQTIDLYQRAVASTKRVLDLIRTPIHTSQEGLVLRRDQVKGNLEFKNIDFGYHERDIMFKNLSLTVPAGQITALVGSTGSGKSTLAKLLLRFYEPANGQILLDGIDVKTLNLKDLRRQIGFVSQDVFLFYGSVLENIVYGLNDVPFEKVKAAAVAAEAHEFIEALPNGYQTVIGDRGQKLSGGQRQRLALARAVLKDPPIMILDEATSAVDNETERLIQKSLDRISVGRTMLIIAHRLSTIRHAHQIYVIEQGRVSEAGTHEELVGKSGVYDWLWKVQTGEAVT